MLKKVIMAILAIGAIASFILLLGSAGALDANCISTKEGTKYMVIFTILFIICVSIDLILAKKGE